MGLAAQRAADVVVGHLVAHAYSFLAAVAHQFRARDEHVACLEAALPTGDALSANRGRPFLWEGPSVDEREDELDTPLRAARLKDRQDIKEERSREGTGPTPGPRACGQRALLPLTRVRTLRDHKPESGKSCPMTTLGQVPKKTDHTIGRNCVGASRSRGDGGVLRGRLR